MYGLDMNLDEKNFIHRVKGKKRLGGGGCTNFTFNVLQLELYNDMKNINGKQEW